MFKTIVLALDGSEAAGPAVSVAGEFARANGSEVVALHVSETLTGRGAELPDPAEAELRAVVRAQVKELSDLRIDTVIEMVEAPPGGAADAIVECSDRSDADLIVAGTRGRSAAVSLIVGSVVHRLLHLSQRPLLIVPSSLGERGATPSPPPTEANSDPLPR